MQTYRIIEPLELHLPDVRELERLSDHQVADQGRGEDLPRLGLGAGPRRQLHAGAEEIAVFLYRFPCADADPNANRYVVLVFVVDGELPLNVDRAIDCPSRL